MQVEEPRLVAGERSSRAELIEIILADLYEQEIVPLKHPAMVHYSPDQVRKALLKHLGGLFSQE
jgi:hypothetical protein